MNNPIISTAKVRGLIKKSGINYVDSTRKWHQSIANGINVWQLTDSVYFRVYGFNDTEKMNANFEAFKVALATIGLTVTKPNDVFGTHEIVKAGA